jgi:hypothetical protein
VVETKGKLSNKVVIVGIETDSALDSAGTYADTAAELIVLISGVRLTPVSPIIAKIRVGIRLRRGVVGRNGDKMVRI